MSISDRLAKLGIGIPRIALPNKNISLEYWAVVACDQFTSQPEYWEETRRFTEAHPSTLNLIIPECYLHDNLNDRIAAANTAMRQYIQEELFHIHPPGFIMLNRSTAHVPNRQGLVLAIDMEAYSFENNSKSLIRSTEDVLLSRLPPRIAMRRNAALELPHILLLIDDPGHTVMNAASAAAAPSLLYNFELMQGGGHVSGRFIEEEAMAALLQAFEALAARSNTLFAVGDGNHSLAAAKEIWEEKKKSGVPADHPARYVLAEVENIHDPGLCFHPIHRIIFNADIDGLASFLENTLPLSSSRQSSDTAKIQLVSQAWQRELLLNPRYLTVETVQQALDRYLSGHTSAEIDYIHGYDDACELAAQKDTTLAILLPNIDKNNFFHRIAHIGHFPRKTFSIGEAREKRYYLEARILEYGQ